MDFTELNVNSENSENVGIGSWLLYNFTKTCEYIEQQNGNRTKTERAYTIKLIDIKQFTNVSNIKQNVNRTETERKTAEKESTISEDDIKFNGVNCSVFNVI